MVIYIRLPSWIYSFGMLWDGILNQARSRRVFRASVGEFPEFHERNKQTRLGDSEDCTEKKLNRTLEHWNLQFLLQQKQGCQSVSFPLKHPSKELTYMVNGSSTICIECHNPHLQEDAGKLRTQITSGTTILRVSLFFKTRFQWTGE